MFDLTEIIAKIAADCDAALRSIKKANELYDHNNPPFVSLKDRVEVKITTAKMVEWQKESLIAYTKAKEHLLGALKEIEDNRTCSKR